jgi:hypothetical protein
MQTRSRFGVAFAALAALGSALAVATLGFVAGNASARVVCPNTAPPADPMAAAYGFISTEIDRRQPARAYALVTAAFRDNEGCKQFLTRNVEGRRFGRVDWSRSTYRVVAGGTGQLVVDVILLGPGTHPAMAGFLMELRQTDAKGGWQVGFWSRRKVEPGELRASAVPA